ncbi:MAG: hypothetical protein EOP09_20220 [Proteobacteria bacterium]|nr:MAG: hypothetical protein EOP09_20220 [Pseudomonadota bacterium]
MRNVPYNTVIVDASPLISCLKIDRFELLEVFGCAPTCLNHVKSELTYFGHEEQLSKLIDAGRVLEAILDTPQLLREFADLHGNRTSLGLGECAAIIYAQNRSLPLVIADKAAINEAKRRRIQCVTTEEVVVLNIQRGSLTLTEADRLLEQWRAANEGVTQVRSFSEQWKTVHTKER